jgi:hypothetical protein
VDLGQCRFFRFRIQTDASVISRETYCGGILNSGMAFPQSHSARRAPRLRLADSIPALVRKENGQRAKAKLRTVSITGGLLRLSNALSQGDFVEVSFQTQTGLVQGLAEMLSPAPGPDDGVLQAFRFIALDDDHHRTLRTAVESAVERSLLEFIPPSNA